MDRHKMTAWLKEKSDDELKSLQEGVLEELRRRHPIPKKVSEKTKQIIDDITRGLSNKDIANKHQVSRQYISSVRKRFKMSGVI